MQYWCRGYRGEKRVLIGKNSLVKIKKQKIIIIVIIINSQ